MKTLFDLIEEIMVNHSADEPSDGAREVLDALSASGFKVVPVEATEAMKSVGEDALDLYDAEANSAQYRRVAADVYRAMVEAAE